jgi:pimeloyl-ACP methyl ester carboxylesterase
MKLKIFSSKHKKIINKIQNNVYYGYYKYIDINGLKTYVIEKGEGIPVILIHGLSTCVYTWRKIFYPLSKRFHVYAFDLRGCGCSEKPKYDYSIESFTRDLKKFMDCFNIEKAILIGNSLGGEIALNMTIKYPERVSKLILIDSSGYKMNLKKTNSLVKLARLTSMTSLIECFISKTILRQLSKIFFVNKKVIDDEFVNAYYSGFRCNSGIRGFVSLIRNLSYTEFYYEKIKEIQKPTLIIWGDHDRIIPVEDAYKIAHDIKNSKLVIIENCGHAAQEECSERLIDEIIKFIFST